MNQKYKETNLQLYENLRLFLLKHTPDIALFTVQSNKEVLENKNCDRNTMQLVGADSVIQFTE
jgi:hypothetical protein